MSPPRTLDEARAAFPELMFFIASGSGMRVQIDVVDEALVSHPYEADTEAEAWALAFPAPASEPVARPQRPPAGPAREEHDLAQLLAPAAPVIGLFD